MDDALQTAYFNRTTLHPLGVLAFVLASAFVLTGARRNAVVPILVMACFIAPGQRIVVLGLDFTLIRAIIFVGLIRTILRKEYLHLSWRPMDTIIVLLAVVEVLVPFLRTGSVGIFISGSGAAYNILGSYFLFRFLIRDWGDLRVVTRTLAWVAVPVAMFFVIEYNTGRNLFGLFGGVPEITPLRDGRLRCQGAFPHPIQAGCFWVGIIPLVATQWLFGRRGRAEAVIAILCAAVVVVTCASSTPIGSLVVGVLAAFLFPLRRHMRWVRWGLVLVLLGLHFLMQGPVWGLLARLSFVGGSTGWQRYHLIDETIKHISEWWLFGTDATAHWGHRTGLYLPNQYVIHAVQGGLLQLGLFIAIIVLGFQSIGRICRVSSYRRTQVVSWAIGVSLLTHTLSFLAVDYSYQTELLWVLTLATITSLTVSASTRQAVQVSRGHFHSRVMPTPAVVRNS